MAVVRLVLAAQEAASVEEVRGDGRFDVPMGNQLEEIALVGGPVLVGLLVPVEQVGRWGKIEKVDVLDAGDGLEKVGKVVALGEPRQLRVVVQANVDQTLDAGLLELGEERRGGLFGEA